MFATNDSEWLWADSEGHHKCADGIVGRSQVAKEDPQFTHKILGGLALASFAWRLMRFGDDDMGFASHPEWTIPTLLLHLTLGASSFQFRIPSKRIATDGGRIWPEYRLHSFVFAARSMACITVNWYEEHFNLLLVPLRTTAMGCVKGY